MFNNKSRIAPPPNESLTKQFINKKKLGGEEARRHSLLRLRKFDLYKKFFNILSLVKRNILISPLEGEKRFLSELNELRNFREGYDLKYSCPVQHETVLEPSPAFVMLTEVRKRLLPLTKREGSDSVISFDFKSKDSTTHENNFPRKELSALVPQYLSNFFNANHSRFTSHFSRKRTAFTLAEVLITLGIIGIVAAITLPTIITNYQDKITVTKVKKAYTIFSQAYLRAIDDNGGLPKEEWDCSKFESTSDGSKFPRCYMSYMLPYLKKVENCYVDSHTRKKCHFSSFIDNNITQGKNTPYYNLHGEIISYLGDGGGAYSIASDGIEFMMYRDYIAIKTDTNSKNILNKNLFFFKLDNNKLRTTTGYQTNIEQYWTGFTCPGCTSIATGWIIQHSNLDYLRCPDKVKINGPYSCK